MKLLLLLLYHIYLSIYKVSIISLWLKIEEKWNTLVGDIDELLSISTDIRIRDTE